MTSNKTSIHCTAQRPYGFHAETQINKFQQLRPDLLHVLLVACVMA